MDKTRRGLAPIRLGISRSTHHAGREETKNGERRSAQGRESRRTLTMQGTEEDKIKTATAAQLGGGTGLSIETDRSQSLQLGLRVPPRSASKSVTFFGP